MQEQFIQERLYLTGVSPKTVDWYKTSFRAFAGALDSKASIIGRIAEIKARGASHITINSYLRVVNAYFHWKDGKGDKCSPQCSHVHIPRLKEEQKVLATLTSETVSSLLRFHAAPRATNLRRAHLVALTILDTGLRASEVLGLTKENIDLDNLVMKIVGKGGKHRLIPFSQELRKMLFRHILKAQIAGGCIIFGTKNNTKVSVHNLDRDFKILGQRLNITGVRFSPHTLRHTFAASYLRNGGNLFYLSKILGHSNITTTQIYLKSLGINELCAVHASFSPLSARQ